MKAKKIVTQSTVKAQGPDVARPRELTTPRLTYARELASFHLIVAAADNGDPRAQKALVDLERIASNRILLKAAKAFRERQKALEVEAATRCLLKAGVSPSARQVQSLFDLSSEASAIERLQNTDAANSAVLNTAELSDAQPADDSREAWRGYYNDCIDGLDLLADRAITGSEVGLNRLFMASRHISCLVNLPEGEEARRIVEEIIQRHGKERSEASDL